MDWRVDSVSVRDSIVVRQVNDTVLVEKWHSTWREKELLKVDTVRVEKEQTTPVQTPRRNGKGSLWLLLVLLGVVCVWLLKLR